MMQIRQSPFGISVLALVTLLVSFATVTDGAAQDIRALSRALSGASDFRVRVQAAFALGNTRNARNRRPLERALSDANPAVRAAAATALGRLGSTAAIAALRRASRDSSASVRMQAQRSIRTLEEGATPTAPEAAPRHRAAGGGFYPAVQVVPEAGRIAWPRVRYAIVLGSMANRTTFRGADRLTNVMRGEVHSTLNLVRGVAVFGSQADLDAASAAQIRRRRIPKLNLDGSLTAVQPRRARGELSVRCEVSLMLLEEGNIRGMLSGAATGSEPPRRNNSQQTQRLAQQALSAAVRSAMSSAPSALARAANR